MIQCIKEQAHRPGGNRRSQALRSARCEFYTLAPFMSGSHKRACAYSSPCSPDRSTARVPSRALRPPAASRTALQFLDKTSLIAAFSSASSAYMRLSCRRHPEICTDAATSRSLHLIAARGFGGRCASANSPRQLEGGDPMSNSNVGSVGNSGCTGWRGSSLTNSLQPYDLRRCAQAFVTRATEVPMDGRSDAVAARSLCPHGFRLEQGMAESARAPPFLSSHFKGAYPIAGSASRIGTQR
jgi:hypothetical protein